jgi:DNA-binding PadR family transcriptional regulator
MAFRGDLEALVLGTLVEGPMHGYAISRQIQERSAGALHFSEGQLYPTLHDLEAAGHVTSEWVPQTGRPARKVYKVKPSGVELLEQKRREWKAFIKAIGRIVG